MSDEREQSSLEDKAALEAKAEEAGNRDLDDEEFDDDDDDVGSPFDHPAFLPVLLWALSIWFGYDGWLTDDPDMLEHATFNRYGFGVLVVLGVYFTIQAVREMRADSENDPEV